MHGGACLVIAMMQGANCLELLLLQLLMASVTLLAYLHQGRYTMGLQ